MRTEVAHVGMKVKVRQEHRILARRGLVGSYGEEENVVADVRISDRFALAVLARGPRGGLYSSSWSIRR
jgi:hypothetical protein